MNCYIPSNLEFEILFPDCRKHKDKYFYFIHKIYEEKLFDKSRYDNDSHVHLHSHTLRNIIGEKTFYPVRENLVSKGVIEINHNYCIDQFSKSYRLTEKYRYEKHRQVNLTDEKILQRISKHKQNLVNDIPEGIEYEFLYKNLIKLDIEYDKANDFIKQNYYNDPEKFNSYMISIDYLNEPEKRFFKVDNIAGRVHTNITNLPSELRQYLNFNGNKLINIDISNSQPFLFNILILNYFSSPSNILLTSNPSFSIQSNTTNNISPYVVTFPKDVLKYMELTSKGKLYEYIMKEAGIEEKKRADFKKKFFGTIFFCNTSDKYTYKEAKLFKKLFPNVYRIILHYKKEDYRQLAIKLQGAEAEIMINKVCKRIAVERPDMFVTTIHDSILTTKDNINYITDVILTEFEYNFNLKPSIKIE